MHVTSASVVWEGLLDRLVRVIREWAPRGLKTEKEYRDALAEFLRDRADKAHIETEYRHSGTTADIYLRWEGFLKAHEVFIELKFNLRQKSQLDRLIGQLEQLNPARNKVILVLCGETSRTLSSRLRQRYKCYCDDPLDSRMAIVSVATGEKDA